MLINVAYKSSRVLRELQTDGPLNPNMHQQQLKAKYACVFGSARDIFSASACFICGFPSTKKTDSVLSCSYK